MEALQFITKKYFLLNWYLNESILFELQIGSKIC